MRNLFVLDKKFFITFGVTRVKLVYRVGFGLMSEFMLELKIGKSNGTPREEKTIRVIVVKIVFVKYSGYDMYGYLCFT